MRYITKAQQNAGRLVQQPQQTTCTRLHLHAFIYQFHGLWICKTFYEQAENMPCGRISFCRFAIIIRKRYTHI